MGVSGVLVARRSGESYGTKWHRKVVTCLLWTLMVVHVIWYDIPWSISVLLVAVCVAMMILSPVLYGMQYAKVLKRACYSNTAWL